MSNTSKNTTGWTLVVTEKAKSAGQVAKCYAGVVSKRALKNQVHVSTATHTVITHVSGHIAQLTYGDRFKRWHAIRYAQLIRAVPERVVNEYYIEFFTKLCKAYPFQRVVLMTDFDDQGELIASDIARLVQTLRAGVQVQRWRTSSLDKPAIMAAIKAGGQLDPRLVATTALRHQLDLKWGVSLTVAFTNAGRGYQRYQKGSKVPILSIGRVQTAVLGMLTRRQDLVRGFTKEQFFVKQLETDIGVLVSKNRFTQGPQSCLDKTQLLPYQYRTTKLVKPAPSPLNVTDLMKLGQRLRMDATTTMSVAESIYLKGLITYPRTDNRAVQHDAFVAVMEKLCKTQWLTIHGLTAAQVTQYLKNLRIHNKAGDKTHPPILPTGQQNDTLSGPELKLLSAIIDHNFRILRGDGLLKRHHYTVTYQGTQYGLSLDQVVTRGHLTTATVPIPKPSRIAVNGIRTRRGQTKPPARYTSASLIKAMEDQGIGTKSTRHTYHKLLQDRNYVRRYVLTNRGYALGRFLHAHLPRLAESNLTAEIQYQLRATDNSTILATYQQLLQDTIGAIYKPELKRQLEEIYRLK